MNEHQQKAYNSARKSGRFGVSLSDILDPERAAQARKKARETRLAMIARDRKRISLGLDPLTRMVKPVTLTRQEIRIRHRMKLRGYFIFRGDSAIYYDDKTPRDHDREYYARSLGLNVTHITKRVPQ